jgi:DNA primase
MAYRREDIERVRAASNLVDLVADVTKVRKTGRSVMAICPFHNEKSPSMSVDPARGLYHCFGCGHSGDVFRFLEDSQGLSFSEAVEFLARRAGIDIQPDPEAAKRQERRQPLTLAVEAAIEFYNARLKSGTDAGGARSYLRSRGYDADIVDEFQIGYSPAQWSELVDALRSSGIGDAAMVKAGLATRSRRGGLVDRFRGRVMFPIHDLRGDAVGFGARLLEGDGPKYLNSPEGPLYHKSQLLYGLHQAKSEIVRAGHSVVVEGYTDVIALHQAGMPVAVATCGTALGEGHFDLLRRFSERIVLAFDADAAGSGASRRGIDISLPGDLDVRVAGLPPGSDPADLVAAGDSETLRKAIEDSQPLLLFAIGAELEQVDLAEPEARIKGVRRAAELVRRHPDPLVRQEYAGVLARRTGVALDEVGRLVGAPSSSGGSRSAAPTRSTGQQRAERELLRALLANHPDVRRLDVGASVFTDPALAAAFELLSAALADVPPGSPPDLGSILGDDAGEQATMLRALALEETPLPDPREVVIKLQVGALERRIEDMRRDLTTIDAASDEYSIRFAELIALERERRQLVGQS